MSSARPFDPIRWIAAALAAVAPGLASACSGSGVGELMVAATNDGWVLFGIAAALTIVGTVVALRNQAPRRALVSLWGLLVLNPGWWLSAFIGDCGTTRLTGALGMTAMTGMVVASPLLSRAADHWSLPRSLALAALTALAGYVFSYDLAWMGMAELALIASPPLLALAVVTTEFLLGASLTGTLTRWSTAESWQRRIVYLAATPLTVLALAVVLELIAMARWLVFFMPSVLADGVDPWMVR